MLRQSFTRFAATLLLMVSLTAVSEAAILDVNCDGTGTYLTIQAAVAVAAAGDTILVLPCTIAPFTYTGAWINGFVDLHLVAAADPGFLGARPEGVGAALASPVVIDDPQQSCVTILNSIDVSVHGFQIRNCNGDGVHIETSQHVVVEGNRIETVTGDGIYSDASFNTRVTGNQIELAGLNGIHLLAAVENLVSDNIARLSGVDGIKIENGGNHSKAFNNSTRNNGGDGIDVAVAVGADHRLERNSSTGNTANDVLCTGAPDLDVIGNTYGGFLNLCGAADVFP